MKKSNRGTHKKIVRHIVTYFVCLLLAVLTWTLVMYAEHEEKGGKSENVSVCLPHCEASGSAVL